MGERTREKREREKRKRKRERVALQVADSLFVIADHFGADV